LVTITPKTFPSGVQATQVYGALIFVDTAVSGLTLGTTDTVSVASNAGANITMNTGANGLLTGYTPEKSGLNGAGTSGTASARSLSNSTQVASADSITTTSSGSGSVNAFLLKTDGPGGTATGYVGARFRLALAGGGTSMAQMIAGTYTFTINATPYTAGTAGTVVSADVSVVISAVSPDASTSTAYIGAGTTAATYNSDTLSVAATASSTTAVANYTITLKLAQ